MEKLRPCPCYGAGSGQCGDYCWSTLEGHPPAKGPCTVAAPSDLNTKAWRNAERRQGGSLSPLPPKQSPVLQHRAACRGGFSAPKAGALPGATCPGPTHCPVLRGSPFLQVSARDQGSGACGAVLSCRPDTISSSCLLKEASFS